jgi:hypothetical protein
MPVGHFWTERVVVGKDNLVQVDISFHNAIRERNFHLNHSVDI